VLRLNNIYLRMGLKFEDEVSLVLMFAAHNVFKKHFTKQAWFMFLKDVSYIQIGIGIPPPIEKKKIRSVYVIMHKEGNVENYEKHKTRYRF